MSVTGSGYIGGLVGFSDQSAGASALTVSGSYYAGGTLTASSTGGAGGLFGYLKNTTGTLLITESHASGTVSAPGYDGGGLIGRTYLGGSVSNTISSSYSSANVSGPENIGGLIGNNFYLSLADTLNVNDCYTTGTVNASISYAGGFVGVNQLSGSPSATLNLTRVYSTSIVTSPSNVNGDVGSVGAGTTVNYTAAYWLQDTGLNAGLATDGNQKSVSALQTQATYTGWTFNSGTGPWNTFVPGAYPTLK